MPRINSNGPSNNPWERWRALRLGTSSSTSDGSSEWSGDSAPETEASSQSPAPSVDSLSWEDPQASPAASSSATSTDGSTQETGCSPQSQSTSSETSASAKEAGQELPPADDTPAPSPAKDDPYAGLSGHELMTVARDAYAEGRLDESEALLARAVEADATLAGSAATARGYIALARAREASPSQPGTATGGPSEEEPAAGGFLAAQ